MPPTAARPRPAAKKRESAQTQEPQKKTQQQQMASPQAVQAQVTSSNRNAVSLMPAYAF